MLRSLRGRHWQHLAVFMFLFIHEKVTLVHSTTSMEKRILDSAPKSDMFNSFHLMPGGYVQMMTELDMLLTIDQFRVLYQRDSSGRKRRKAIQDNEISAKWPGCKVYYEIMDSLNEEADKKVIKEAINEWQKYTCLSFEYSRTRVPRIQFKNGGGCYSSVGMQKTVQPIVLARGCRTKGIIAHEIGHAIGWFHEHMRPDRDKYIFVNFDAIPHRFKDNFKKYNTDVIKTHGVPYDYTSIMHYGSDAIPDSIITLDPRYQDKIGQRSGFSFKDIKIANLMYDCAAAMKCSKKTCSHDGFQMYKPFNGERACECFCDSGKIEEPLIHCSKVRKVPPPPNPKPTVKPPPKNKCFDVREDCAKRKEEGECMFRMEMMMDDCAKTCDFCGKGGGMCMDHDPSCPVLASARQCEDPGLKQTLASKCPASCGLCPKPPDPCKMQQVMMGKLAPVVSSRAPLSLGMNQERFTVVAVMSLLCGLLICHLK